MSYSPKTGLVYIPVHQIGRVPNDKNLGMIRNLQTVGDSYATGTCLLDPQLKTRRIGNR